MVQLIEGFLDKAFCASIREKISQCEFIDGGVTVIDNSNRLKNNLQLDHKDALPIMNEFERLIFANAVIELYARPRLIPRMLINKYEEGMTYGDHVDAAIMNRLRCDVSFTIFLSDQEEYDGGELIAQLPERQIQLKPPMGSIFLYPSGLVHRVNPVTRGARIACAGWIQSRIRDPIKRGVLSDLAGVHDILRSHGATEEQKLLLVKTILQLERIWDEF